MGTVSLENRIEVEKTECKKAREEAKKQAGMQLEV